MASLRQLFDSLSREQKRNQDLLVSLAFALRSFTNLNRFLELVPVVAARLVNVEGAVLVPFQADGRLWRDQLQAVPVEPCQELLRRLSGLTPGQAAGFGTEDSQLLAMDRLVQRQLPKAGMFTSVVARGRPRGRLYLSIRMVIWSGPMSIAVTRNLWPILQASPSKMTRCCRKPDAMSVSIGS